MFKNIFHILALTLVISLISSLSAKADEITFDNRNFVLKATAQSLNLPDAMNEYFLKDENHNFWTKMIGVYHLPKIKDPIDYAEELDRKLSNSETCVLLKFVQNKKTDQAVISYLESGIENGKNFFTYNVFKYEKNPLKGITEFRYSAKYFFKDKNEITKIANTVKSENDKYMTMLISSPVPPIVEKELTP